MVNKYFSLVCFFIFSLFFSQWNNVSAYSTKKNDKISQNNPSYLLDIARLKNQLNKTPETGKNKKAIEILIPTLEGKLERFSVYSAPVVVPELASRYDLNSYVGVGIDDTSKYIRFSLSGNDFQSMIIKNGFYEFIEPINTEKTLYKVFSKNKKSATSTPFVCSTEESTSSRKQIEELFNSNKIAQFNATNFTTTSDRKFRTYRLAISTTGEYTQYFGGVQGALTAINATLTRVNGIFEKDLGVRLILQNFPQLIYNDPNNDPYSPAGIGASGAWSNELQSNLTSTIGNAAYDIGHLFGASGGGGDAGCIGCICVNPTIDKPKGKGSAFTAPADGKPEGDTFDIDFVIHEFGHQLGASHTFSHTLEDYDTNVEPASGSTIMAYPGITNSNVQMTADDYFHGISISQIQQNLQQSNCAQTINITNTPPIITLKSAKYTIPKSTAFILTADVTDRENNPLSYTWEQMDNALSPLTSINGYKTNGALFRSVKPTNTSTRYFPKLPSVMAGKLTNSSEWESVSHIAREINFRLTVRDNHPISNQQLTSFADQKIIVGKDGPFKVNLTQGANLFAGVSNTITWNVANTNLSPYNVSYVKISYTTDNGITWENLTASTPNNGSAAVTIPLKTLNQTNLQIRIDAIDNVFFAVSPKVNVVANNSCIVTVPINIEVSNIEYTTAQISWDKVPNISNYIFEYRKKGDTHFIQQSLQSNNIILNNLEKGTTYEYRIKSSCLNKESEYSELKEFKTLSDFNCISKSQNFDNVYIQKVEIDRNENTSEGSNYSNFTTEPFRYFYLNKNNSEFNLRITPKWHNTITPISVAVWIDFNSNGFLEPSEQIFAITNTTERELLKPFQLPKQINTNSDGVKMRVSLKEGNSLPMPCEQFSSGEVEDYQVIIKDVSLMIKDISQNLNTNQVYPNPFIGSVYTTNIANGTPYNVYDMSGRLIVTGKIFLNKVDLSILPIGTYIFQISGQKGVKIIK